MRARPPSNANDAYRDARRRIRCMETETDGVSAALSIHNGPQDHRPAVFLVVRDCSPDRYGSFPADAIPSGCFQTPRLLSSSGFGRARPVAVMTPELYLSLDDNAWNDYGLLFLLYYSAKRIRPLRSPRSKSALVTWRFRSWARSPSGLRQRPFLVMLAPSSSRGRPCHRLDRISSA